MIQKLFSLHPLFERGHLWYYCKCLHAHKMIYPHQVWLDGLYMSEPIVKDDAKGTAPFLFAYAEMCRLEK